MDRETEDLWAFIAKQRNIRSELLAVMECQKGTPEPLLLVLGEYGLPNELIALICLTIKDRTKPPKLTKRFAVGHEIEKRLRQRPGEKKAILAQVSESYRRRAQKLTPKTAENYHTQYLRAMKKRGWTRADVDEIRALYRDPTLPT